MTTLVPDSLSCKCNVETFYSSFFQIVSVVVLLDTSGRIDHIFAHISTLVKAQIFLKNVSIFILSKDSIAWLLNAGEHVIHVPQEFVDKKLWCSFVPIDGKCCVSTTGFKWNLG